MLCSRGNYLNCLKIQHNQYNVIGLQNINPFCSIYVHISTDLCLVTTSYVTLLWFEFGQPSAIELKTSATSPIQHEYFSQLC